MSRERARRRAERERERELAAAHRERRAARARRWAALGAGFRGGARRVLPRRTRWARPGGRLAERRRTQNGVIAALFLTVQLATWLLSGGWMVRVGVLVLSVLLLPVFVTLILDRRS